MNKQKNELAADGIKVPKAEWIRRYKSIPQRRCTCGGCFRSDILPFDLGDSIPELGIEECIVCGTLWLVEEARPIREALTTKENDVTKSQMVTTI